MITKKYCYKNKTEECEEVYDLYDFPFDIIVNYCCCDWYIHVKIGASSYPFCKIFNSEKYFTNNKYDNKEINEFIKKKLQEINEIYINLKDWFYGEFYIDEINRNPYPDIEWDD